MYGTSDFKKGLKILVKDQPHVILDFQHIKPGKGNQFTRTKLKNLVTNTNVDMTCRSGEKFGIPDIVYKELNYLYKDQGSYCFMDQKTYETIEISSDIIQKNQYYLIENLQASACFFNGKICSIELPKSVVLKITKTEPGFKGNTVSNTTKPCTLETGLILQVPLHINEGDKIKVNTTNGTYVERVSE